MATALVGLTGTSATPLDGFLIMLHSASSARAAELGREQIERHYHQLLTSAFDGDRAPQRAALVLALVAGVQVMRQMIGLTALAKADPAVLIELLTPIFQQLVAREPARGSRPSSPAAPVSARSGPRAGQGPRRRSTRSR
jgi:hypothetical protein